MLVAAMRAVVADPDPLRRVLRAMTHDHVFEVRINGEIVEIASGNGAPVGRVLTTPAGGSVWLGRRCVAEYTFDNAAGYAVTPITDGLRVPESMVAMHPLDYLLDLASRE